VLIDHWKKDFPRIEKDLEEAFKSIRQDYRKAKNARSKPGFNDTLFKYRQKSTDLKRGASYGFRIYAYYDISSNILYPIVVYPKTAMQEFDLDKLREAVSEVCDVVSQLNSGSLPFPPDESSI